MFLLFGLCATSPDPTRSVLNRFYLLVVDLTKFHVQVDALKKQAENQSKVSVILSSLLYFANSD